MFHITGPSTEILRSVINVDTWQTELPFFLCVRSGTLIGIENNVCVIIGHILLAYRLFTKMNFFF